MPRHEDKICPRCGVTFECKVGTVLICQCSSVDLSREERAYIMDYYDDCLCADCLRELKADHTIKDFPIFVKHPRQ
ncbi:MAG: cysteine-rich CWC family protein [Pseudomonadota bacterium]|nr:cysteine-rich CWC family protein [Gammaproteobacteria bacterium]MDQ3581829.1 cysteine-rich CWC family protein [Pseudomonadota bacterium]